LKYSNFRAKKTLQTFIPTQYVKHAQLKKNLQNLNSTLVLTKK